MNYLSRAEVGRLLCQEQGSEEGGALEELWSSLQNPAGLAQVQGMASEAQLVRVRTMAAYHLEQEFVAGLVELAVLRLLELKHNACGLNDDGRDWGNGLAVDPNEKMLLMR